ncbi:hypothetical protein GCM10011583_73390 [Streptomyces camponoticapitis]|uniref:Uncharacterized protein n=1 Tax=Streptomyces camponoticapitis TaxID=1616125 RepID=A0ABQ2EX91_9ACTN|nr:SpoIIE family protein phosphatase [Streptomyces camponoticapitis]GGK30816.1 hypothetical protein GCM10011583_73390 [Streptomyces camponoticapitis]
MSAEEGASTTAEVERALAELVRATGAHIGVVYLLKPEDQTVRMAFVTGVSQRIAMPWSQVALAATVPVAEAARGRPVWVANHAELARRFPRTALALPYHVAMSAVPLASGGTRWGALLQMWPATHAPDLSDQETWAIDDGASRISGLLLRAMQEGHPLRPTELRTVSPPLARHAEPGAELTERFPEGTCALDLDGRITFLTKHAVDLLGSSREGLLGARLWEALPWLNDPGYENSYLGALFSRLPASFTALRPPDRWLAFHLYPDATGISVRITPCEAPRDDVDPVLMPTEEPARPGNLFRLLHLSSTLTDAVGVEDVTEAVTNQIMPVINAQALALVTADEGRLHVLGWRGFRGDIAAGFDRLPVTADTPVVRTILSGEPLFSTDGDELRRTSPSVRMDPDKSSFAYLPMFASGRTIGCCVLGYDRRHTFSLDERAVLTSLAGVIAQALERARLYDSKNQVALGLQAALLPQELPKIPSLQVVVRYLPATDGLDIGGDFYDLIRLDDTSAGAVIGDVQGHNVNAAALMGQVRTAVHAYASAGASPDEVLARTNRLLIDSCSTLFTSCLYAHLDLRDNRARLATAGHLPPILLHPDGHTEILDVPTGILLGVEPQPEYRTVDVSLPPGSVLAFYTDGLVEVPGIDLGRSIDELAAQLGEGDPRSLESLSETLVRCAERTRQSFRGGDDIALLLIKSERE